MEATQIDRIDDAPVAAPTFAELTRPIEQISQRVGRHLERHGWLIRDVKNAYLDWDPETASPLDDLAGRKSNFSDGFFNKLLVANNEVDVSLTGS